MPHTTLLQENSAGEHYVHSLVSALRNVFRISDPSYADIQDREIWWKIQRDAVIQHAIQTRRLSVAGTSWSLTPATDSEQDKLAASDMTELLSVIHRFGQSRFALTEAIFRGSSYAFIEGKRDPLLLEGDERPRNFFVPTGLKHVDRFRFRQRRVNDEPGVLKIVWDFFSIQRERWEELQHPEWFIRHVHQNEEGSLNYGRGLLSSIYYMFWAKTIALSEGLAGLERWAQGLLIAEIDGAREGSTLKTNDDLVEQWITVLDKMRSKHVIVQDIRDKIRSVDGPSQGYQQVRDMLEYLDKSITQLILTSVLPTGGGSDVGSNARAEVEAQSSEATFAFDRQSLAESIDHGLVAFVWSRNRPALHERYSYLGLPMPKRPKFVLNVQTRQDPREAAEIIASLISTGIPLKKSEVYERTGFSVPGPDDDIIMAGPKEEPASNSNENVTPETPSRRSRSAWIQTPPEIMPFGNGAF